MFFSVYTLGCKLNQLETEAITDSFCKAGFTFIPWESVDKQSAEALLLVINTCTVTSMAEQKARRIIRKALCLHPESCLLITGCYAQLEKAALETLENELSPRRLFIIPGEKKDRIMDLPRFLAGVAQHELNASALPELIASWLDRDRGVSFEDGSFRFMPEQFASHSRGFLKIQDGCDHSCAYCRVSLARGKSRSLAAKDALEALRSLEQRGFGEAVLTGVNISQYRDSETELPGLLDFLLAETEKIRIRLSSIEPDGLTPQFIRVLENHRIRPHIHLSLQSGSGEILSKMGRTYTPGDVENAVKLIRSIREDPFLACDIITGFPGETEREFEKTEELCEKLDFAWIHAFPFSPRPGTAAFNFPHKVSERDSAKRAALLGDLARKGRLAYIRRWEGKEAEAVIEKDGAVPEGHVRLVSENYLKLLISCGEEPTPKSGSLVRCRILTAAQDSALNPPGKRIDAFAELIPGV